MVSASLEAIAAEMRKLEEAGVQVSLRNDFLATDFGYVLPMNDGWAARLKVGQPPELVSTLPDDD
jgi:hypothetical protein